MATFSEKELDAYLIKRGKEMPRLGQHSVHTEKFVEGVMKKYSGTETSALLDWTTREGLGTNYGFHTFDIVKKNDDGTYSVREVKVYDPMAMD